MSRDVQLRMNKEHVVVRSSQSVSTIGDNSFKTEKSRRNSEDSCHLNRNSNRAAAEYSTAATQTCSAVCTQPVVINIYKSQWRETFMEHQIIRGCATWSMFVYLKVALPSLQAQHLLLLSRTIFIAIAPWSPETASGCARNIPDRSLFPVLFSTKTHTHTPTYHSKCCKLGTGTVPAYLTCTYEVLDVHYRPEDHQ
jgi:hypothetical protein